MDGNRRDAQCLPKSHGHFATQGKVLVAGGVNESVISSAELYDSANGIWTATGTMTALRMRHSAASLPNGKVLVAGGYGGNADSSVVSSADLYDSATGTWTTTASMSTPRVYFPMVLLGSGKVLAAGGYDHYTPIVARAELYESEFTAPFHITAQPQSQLGYRGKWVTFSVSVADGVPPYGYQWLKDEVQIPDATNSLLALTNLQLTNAGVYTVVVSDTVTDLASQPATLTVDAAGVSTAPQVACPTPATYDCASAAGVALKLQATVTDPDNGQTLTVTLKQDALVLDTQTVSTPANNATVTFATLTFAPGAYLLTIEVSDETTSSSCDTAATVRGPRTIGLDVLAQLSSVQPPDKDGAKKLADAIAELAEAINPAWWGDDFRLQPKQGEHVFNAMKDGVRKLDELGRKTSALAPTLRPLIAREVLAARILVQVVLPGAAPKDLADAQKEQAKGDAEATIDNPDNAIDHYKNAWKKAIP